MRTSWWESARDTLRGINSVERRESDLMTEAVRFATLAPSAHNTQPWSFTLRQSAVELHADLSRALPVSDPEHRELIISCGAALENMRLTVRHRGYEDVVEAFPDPADPTLVARLRLGRSYQHSRLDCELFRAITKRHANREAYRFDPVPEDILHGLEERAGERGAIAHVVSNPGDRKALADLVAEGDRRQSENAAFRDELARWVRPNAGATDGILASAVGIPRLVAPLAARIIRGAPWGGVRASHDRALALAAPVLLVLWTPSDTQTDWLMAGQGLERMLLFATHCGLSTAFLNQPIQVSELRERLRRAWEMIGFPQLIVRMGYGDGTRPTPRRPLRDVVAAH